MSELDQFTNEFHAECDPLSTDTEKIDTVSFSCFHTASAQRDAFQKLAANYFASVPAPERKKEPTFSDLVGAQMMGNAKSKQLNQLAKELNLPKGAVLRDEKDLTRLGQAGCHPVERTIMQLIRQVKDLEATALEMKLANTRLDRMCYFYMEQIENRQREVEILITLRDQLVKENGELSDALQAARGEPKGETEPEEEEKVE